MVPGFSVSLDRCPSSSAGLGLSLESIAGRNSSPVSQAIQIKQVATLEQSI